MSDPSSNVESQLLPHVHLVVSWPQPYQHQQLSPDQAVALLLQAAQAVTEKAVSWQYLHLPSDGTLLLAWQPLDRLGDIYATDGYVWTGQEHEFAIGAVGDCNLQVFVAEAGFIPIAEQFTLHRRVRYRIQSSTGNTFDPALELVHYTAAFPEHQVPTAQTRVATQVSQQLAERKFLEQQGTLPRREFLLHDMMNYPQLNVPRAPIPGNPYQQHAGAGAALYGRGPMQRPQPAVSGMRVPTGMGPSPSKRAGQQRVGGMQPNPFALAQQHIPEYLLDEDNHVFGDALDFLTPRELSLARFIQHHEWMEETLSSTYTTSQIIPVNLGLKSQGELGPLIEDLYGESKLEDSKDSTDEDQPQRFTQANIAEFEKKVAKFMEKSANEIEMMKQEHEAKMKEMHKQKLFTRLDHRLAETFGTDSLEEATREAETATGMKLMVKEDVVQVQKGGILDKIEEHEYIHEPSQQPEFPDFGDMDTAGEALDFFDSNMDYTNP